MEEIFGKEYISSSISRAKFYRDPKTKEERKPDEDPSEVKG